MKNFVLGMVCGALMAIAAAAGAAQLVGGSGYLMGWTVEVNGEEVCSDPYVWVGVNEIECD